MSAIPHGGRLVNRLLAPTPAQEIIDNARSLATYELTHEKLRLTENIAFGALSPLRGFMGKKDLMSVLATMRLSDMTPWPIPITLDCAAPAAARYKEGAQVLLTYQGEPVATLELEEKFEIDTGYFCSQVFATQDPAHPGVAAAKARGPVMLSGPISLLKETPSPFAARRLHPAETRALFTIKGWNTVTAFQTRNVPHNGHEFVQKIGLSMTDAIFIHPVVGLKKSGDFEDQTIIDCYEELFKDYFPQDHAALAVLHYDMFYAGPREALLHAIIRKNYGCTHFIVGRDHAGVGNYYGPYAAQDIFASFPDLGIQAIAIREVYHCKRCGTMTTDKLCPHSGDDLLSISATLIRKHLSDDSPMPNHLMRPEIARILRAASRPIRCA
ncbi:MAG: sulfate adenylyltransferase [Elusimicrobiota bacterium]